MKLLKQVNVYLTVLMLIGAGLITNEASAQQIEVRTKQELLQALKAAKAGQTIYIQDNATIDLSGEQNLDLPGKVTLASGGTKNGVGGALLYTHTNGTLPLFRIAEQGSRITGLRIKGPDTEIYAGGVDHFEGKSAKEKVDNRTLYYRRNMYSVPVSRGIVVTAPATQIDNCELFGWTHAAVLINEGGDAKIYNSNIHHNQRFGLGYGICLDKGNASIYGNTFDYNSHSIAGTGSVGTSYDVYDNVFYEHHERAWAVDMHGGADRKDGTNIAGTSIKIHDNIFHIKYDRRIVKGIVIRGVPTQGAVIKNNKFYIIGAKANEKMPLDASFVIKQTNAKGNMQLSNNKIEKK